MSSKGGLGGPGPSTLSQSTLLELRAITAEHKDQFAKEGGSRSVKGGNRRPLLDPAKSKDPFARPSPGLVKRLAQEARNDAKQRHFIDDGSGPSDEQRREILKAKSKKYEALARGDLSGLSERELAEAAIDFEKKAEEWSDHSSDQDESARSPRRLKYQNDDDDDDDEDERYDDLALIEYVDELGRTRKGTRREAREAGRARKKEDARPSGSGSGEQRDRDGARVGSRNTKDGHPGNGEVGSAYAEVLQSNVIHGDQAFFPVYEPDPDALRKKYLAAEIEARAHHYDSSKEVRNRGAGAYQFSLDETARAAQMSSLDSTRRETEQARASAAARGGLTAAQEAKRRKLEERKALIESKRRKVLGGEEGVEEKRRKIREKEAERFLEGLEGELGSEFKEEIKGGEMDE